VDRAGLRAANAEDTSGSSEISDESSEGESEGDSSDEGDGEANRDEVTPPEPMDEAVDIMDQSLILEAFESRAPLVRSLLAPGAAAVEVVGVAKPQCP
ncbi:hypothetical protein GUJ93_ZPchr0009g450, partial [Zizania palustris]